ncbi:PREDICTED: gastric triacylglycerol lipase-like [Amphimedon queenslandica]|uniref:Lipase n=1 Tax=Amphimedon queenslandica TaxID=400682 RepID=A0A1X7VMM7_AMPQE|nr:PREDICTED: gastric triacylglycerol lipase-like [Amphimedon queenslandica]|eukprot:XP_003383462.2 PREDICTED: gastric triacylglycerol lipase-like [Amphimedon queenslandica]
MARIILIACLFHFIFASTPPEAKYTPLQMITSAGYPGESHSVTTRDGYVLGLQRISYGRTGKTNATRPVIFLQHGLLCASTNWITNGPSDSLGFILADAGFDVWLGNVRGNTYSREHVKYNPDKDKEFWDFSFDEHALIDLPTMIDYALSVSGQNSTYYVGHSQGTMMGFAGFSSNATLASKIRGFFALAPVSTVKDIEGMFAYIAKIYKVLVPFFSVTGVGEFVPNKSIIDKAGELFCFSKIEEVCGNVLFLICGFDEKNLNDSLIPVYLGHTPAGTSVQNVVHWAQMVKSGAFQMYDYGSASANKEHYNGNSTPPLYNLSQFPVPTYLFTGNKDWLADPTDVKGLINKLNTTSNSLKGVTNIPYYEHLDFIWGIDAAEKVYKVIISYINGSN